MADQRVTISQLYTVTRDYSSEYCVTTNFLEADFWPAGMSGPNPDARRVITSLIIHDLGQQAERAGSELYTCCAYYVHVNGARIRSFVDNSGVRGNPSLKFLGCAFFCNLNPSCDPEHRALALYVKSALQGVWEGACTIVADRCLRCTQCRDGGADEVLCGQGTRRRRPLLGSGLPLQRHDHRAR